MNIRNAFYWFVDRWKKNSEVYRNLRQIQDSLSKEYKSQFDEVKVRQLLDYAIGNIPFYSHISSDSNISDFPIVNKTLIRDSLSDFVDINNLKYYKKVSTSGSTGTPFSSYQDKKKIIRNSADTIFFGSLVGYTLGEKLLYIKLWNAANYKSKILRLKQNIECIDVTDQSPVYIEGTTIKVARRSKKIHMLAYASYYDQLLNYLKERDLKLKNLGSALAMSEGLSLNTKNQLNVEVFSRYSNVENGIIAQQVPGSNGKFLVNTASYLVEILDLEKDIPVPLGQLGRIVITDLYNMAMPFIRYDTGDLAVMEYDNIDNYFYFTEVHGRKMDLVFDTKFRPVSPLTINNNMLLFPEVIQYQFIQLSDDNFQFILNIKPENYFREEELISFFKKILGETAKLSVKYVTEIPVLASGKRKQVINLSEQK